MGRKKVLDQVNINTSMFMTSLENAAKILIEQKDKLEKEGWTNLHLKMKVDYDWSELVIMGMRMENDDEYTQRLFQEQKKLLAAQKKAERELKKYNKLKLKYDS